MESKSITITPCGGDALMKGGTAKIVKSVNNIMKIDFSRGCYFATFTKVKGLIEILKDLT
jgi:hypothetical protein